MSTSTSPKKKSPLGRLLAILAVPVALVVGLSIGASGGDAPAEPPAPVVVTETPEPEVRTEFKTPESCLEALDHANTVNEYASEGFTLASDAMNAAATFDPDGITAATDAMSEVQPKYEDAMVQFYLSAELCRAEVE